MSEAPRAEQLAHDEEKGQCDHLEKHESRASAVRDDTGARSKTNPAEIRLVRKLDWIILPMLWIMYWLNYLDRNAITVARLDNLEEELNLSSTEYQTCVSILFVGYILGQIPSSSSPFLPIAVPSLTFLRHAHDPSSTFPFHVRSDGPLGRRQHPHRHRKGLQGPPPYAFLPRHY